MPSLTLRDHYRGCDLIYLVECPKMGGITERVDGSSSRWGIKLTRDSRVF